MTLSTLLLATLVLTDGSAMLRDLAARSPAGYVVLLALLHALVTLPLVWYRSFRLEHEYGLSHMSTRAWARDYAKSAALTLALAVLAAELLYSLMRAAPTWWWLFAALAGAGYMALLTLLAPVCILPLFHRFRPIGRDTLRLRLLDLSARAGVPVLSVQEWGLGEKTRRANAALVGAGATRRILLSDTLLADYTDDEIEVVLAHEIGHHVHRDVMKALCAELLVLMGAAYAAALALRFFWSPLGLRAPDDIAGLPVILLAAGAVLLIATPVQNAWSRRNERRADGFALELTSRPQAFIAAMRRMAAQNMAEERPTLAARWFFNTHPSVEERIGHARRIMEAQETRASRMYRRSAG